MASEAIIEKIQYLLKLAQGNTNINEAAAAFAAAQQLLMKHNLDQAQVEAVTGLKSAGEKIVDDVKPLYVGRRVILWKDHLANSLSMLNSCKMYIHNAWKLVPGDVQKEISYRVIGRPSDVEMVRYFFNSIVTQIEQLSAEALRLGKGSGKTFTNNFKIAAGQVVVSRLREMNQNVREEHAKEHGSAALVLVDQKAEAVEQWTKDNLELKPRSINYKTAADPDGYRAGREAGEKVSLNKGMSENKNDQKLLV